MERETNNLAIVSLVAGITGWTILPFLGGVVAIVTGHMARGQIRDAAGTEDGEAFALAGLVLGYVNVALGCLAGIGFVALIAVFGSVLAALQAASGG